MKKNEVKALAEKYNMDFLKSDEITMQNIGVWCESHDLIPELDALIDKDAWPCVVDRVLLLDSYYYRVYCPTDWIDLCGWC